MVSNELTAGIQVKGLTKRYGRVNAVEDLTFSVNPGTVTGFLGPNGAGKSTTMRMILGLDRPSSGRAMVAGRRYADWPVPTQLVGSLLDASSVESSRTAKAHLAWIARASGAAPSRVDAVLQQVGIAKAAEKPANQLSLGMRQRLGLAAALLGEPRILILDEPLNGLDPDGIVWLRQLLRDFADRGGTVLLSSHLMNEMQATADHVVVINHGRLLAEISVAELRTKAAGSVRVQAEGVARILPFLNQRGAHVETDDATPDRLIVSGIEPKEINQIAWDAGIVLNELSPSETSLETAFLELTHQEPTPAGEEGVTP